MCGIVGLLLKDRSLRPRLGELMVPMLVGMTERGPDSSGMAVFADSLPKDKRKLSLHCDEPGFDWRELESAWIAALGAAQFEPNANHCIVSTTNDLDAVRAWLRAHYAGVHVLSAGRSIDLYKDIGLPSEVAQACLFLAGSGSSFITGSEIVVSGGSDLGFGPKRWSVVDGYVTTDTGEKVLDKR